MAQPARIRLDLNVLIKRQEIPAVAFVAAARAVRGLVSDQPLQGLFEIPVQVLEAVPAVKITAQTLEIVQKAPGNRIH